VLFAVARFVAFAGRAVRFAAARRNDVRRPALRVVRVALIAFALAGLLCHHRPASNACFVLVANYFLLSTMLRSVRLLLRVFLPNVGKAHGVCG
jgi:hypothetical protein